MTVHGGAVKQCQAYKPAAEVQLGPPCPTLLAGPMALQRVTGTLPVAGLPLATALKNAYGLRCLPEPQPQQVQTADLSAGHCLPCLLLTSCWQKQKVAFIIREVLTLQTALACCASTYLDSLSRQAGKQGNDLACLEEPSSMSKLPSSGL